MADPVINPELAKLLPAHSKEELAQLKANVKADGGLTDPILLAVLDGVETVLDGMTRWGLVEKDREIPHGFKYVTTVTTLQDAKLWVLEHQLGRRNLLKPEEVREVRGRYYNELMAAQLTENPLELEGWSGQNVPTGVPSRGGNGSRGVRKRAAKKAGVSEKTISRDAKWVKAIDSFHEDLRTVMNDKGLKVCYELALILAAKEKPQQKQVATSLRMGRTRSFEAAMKECGLIPKTWQKKQTKDEADEPKNDQPAPATKPPAKAPEPPAPPVEEPEAAPAQPPKGRSKGKCTVVDGAPELIDGMVKNLLSPLSREINKLGKLTGETAQWKLAYDGIDAVLWVLKRIKNDQWDGGCAKVAAKMTAVAEALKELKRAAS